MTRSLLTEKARLVQVTGVKGSGHIISPRAELQTMQLANDADPTILELYWGEAGTEEKDVAGISNRPARLIAGGACGAASLLVVIVIAWVARREGKR